MVREISAGGVVLRKRGGTWWIAVIELPSAPVTGAAESASAPTTTKPGRSKPKPVLALPKGLVDAGEKPLEAALREVTWGDGARVFKIVSFFMLRYESGRINDISAEMRIEVARARWVPLEDAASLLAYRGEKQMARKAFEYVAAHPDF
jgi:8-oxo-dGTP pyrophosphatase MutT (NUDIX family)